MKTIYTYLIFILFGLLLITTEQAVGQRHNSDRDNERNTKTQRSDYQHDRGYNTRNKDVYHTRTNTDYNKKKQHNYKKHHKPSVTVYWRIPDTYTYRGARWDHHVYRKPPWRNHYRPIALHTNRGNVYYHHGRFYRYDNYYGYVIVETPSHLIFTTVPADFHRVRIHGDIYYRHGDIWMERTYRGYRLWRG